MMFGWLVRLHAFGDKLTWLLTLTSGGAIVGVCVVLSLIDYFHLRHEAIAALESHTMIVAMNSGAPLAFADAEAGAEALAAFRTRPHVAQATLFDLRGRPFATYAGPAVEAAPQLAAQPTGSHDVGRWHVVSVAIEEREQSLGRLQVVHDLDYTHGRLWRNLLLSLFVTAGAVLLVYLFSRRIADVVMHPIAALSRTATDISVTRDYGLRAQKLSNDELGRFVDTFNEMLAQIQQQDLELQAARTEAEAANRLKDDFLATLSHELRTPLTPILGWTQILHRIAGDDARVRQAADVIERSARSQAQIVDDLLDMSRIISGKLRLQMQRLDIDEVIAAALETVRPAADARGVDLRCRLDPGAEPIRGDPHRLQQVIWNLLSNAIRFTDRGGTVEIDTLFAERHVTVTVRDSGLGISAEFLPHVFERFRQADGSITRSHGGLGLGLAIARQLIELHGGTVRASSEGIGRGATFEVWLPRQPPDLPGNDAAPAVQVAPSAQPAPPRLDGLHLLLVDADADARALLTQWIEQAGATVDAVDSAAAALQRLAEQLPDVLVCDTALAGADPYAFLQGARERTRAGALPAIALTAFARSDERAKALLAGYQMHVSRPVERTELLVAIARAAGRA